MTRTRCTLAVAAAWLLVLAVLVPTAQADPRAAGRPSTAGVIVWTTRASTGEEYLMIASADGSHRRQLTPAQPDTVDTDARISPDGTWITYEEDTADGSTVRLVRPDGSHNHPVDIRCVAPCAAVGTPTWLSDRRLAFIKVSGPFDPHSGDAASVVLYSAHLDGSHVKRLSPPGTEGVYEDARATVSRDGSYLTFVRNRLADHASAIFRMSARGRHVRQLTPWGLAPDVFDLSHARSGPTKNLILFESYGRGDPDATFVDLATVPATCHSLKDCTARIHWITDNAATGRRNANAQWSPDGSSLVFTNRSSIDEPNADIWTMRYGGTVRTKISTSKNFDYRPAWGRSRDCD